MTAVARYLGQSNIWCCYSTDCKLCRRKATFRMNDVMIFEVRGKCLEIVTGSGNSLVTHFKYHWYLSLSGSWGTETDPPGRAFILLCPETIKSPPASR